MSQWRELCDQHNFGMVHLDKVESWEDDTLFWVIVLFRTCGFSAVDIFHPIKPIPLSKCDSTSILAKERIAKAILAQLAEEVELDKSATMRAFVTWARAKGWQASLHIQPCNETDIYAQLKIFTPDCVLFGAVGDSIESAFSGAFNIAKNHLKSQTTTSPGWFFA